MICLMATVKAGLSLGSVSSFLSPYSLGWHGSHAAALPLSRPRASCHTYPGSHVDLVGAGANTRYPLACYPSLFGSSYHLHG